jgi:hypothetical protein
MRCAIKEDVVMTLYQFCKGLNNDFEKEIMLIGVFTLDQANNIMQDYELLTKNQ